MQGVGYRPERFGVSCVLAAVCNKGHGVTALRGCAAYGHKAGRDLFQVFVPFNSLTFDHASRLQYQLIFCVQVVTNGDGHTHGKMLNVVKNALANTGNVHAQIGEVVFFKQLLDLLCLVPEVHPFPVNHLQNAEFLHGEHRRRHNHKTGQIPAASRIKAAPYWPVTKWPGGVRVMILPGIHFHAAGFQVGKAENGIFIVHEHAHIEHVESGCVVAVAQLLDVGQIEAARNSILHRNDVAPLAIRTNPPAVAQFIKGRKLNGSTFFTALFPSPVQNGYAW